LNNTDIKAENIESFRLKMGYIAQSAPLPKGKLDDVLSEIASFKGNEHLEIDREAIVKAIERFHMPAATLEKHTTELSGGERQRVCFALLTLLKRKVWLLDEITSGLDLANSELILREVEETDATVLITAHDDVWGKINLKKITLHE
jgi:putative ABC transport system ATP-binding protein